MTDNLSAVLVKQGELVLKQMPLPPKPGKNEVILRTMSVGICGSDVHYWDHGCIGDFVVDAPIILGHETSAMVHDVGEGVVHVKPGDIVAIEPGVPCSTCPDCKEGRYNLCKELTFHATPPYDGTLTRFFKHHANYCFKLPPEMGPDEGALLEPLSVGVYSVRRAGVNAGDTLLICGAGPIGLVTMLAARAFAASHICISDMNEQRLKMAEDLGADSTVLIKKEDSAADIAKKVHEKIGSFPHNTIDCVGVQSTITVGILATKPGGSVVVTGMGQATVTLPLSAAMMREVDIKGVWRYKNTWPLCLQLIKEKKIDVKKLVTHRYPLEKALDAFQTAKSGAGIKVIIDCGSQQE